MFQRSLTLGLTPPPTGGRRRRGLAVADRDLLPQPADAEGRQEPAGRLRRPLSGVRAGALAWRGGGARHSPSTVGERRQHLRGVRRRTVRRRRITRRTRKWRMNEVLCRVGGEQ